ncbi:unnamed protein product [Brachionus calyciflorus]|uniref:Uncharacterized protein n=1 Tax=Brachionus calyciflorus TaxID=104777 RepID=A0A813TXT5_9BILA|nr:unnamed protein product [Brachionus calyciflorus]
MIRKAIYLSIFLVFLVGGCLSYDIETLKLEKDDIEAYIQVVYGSNRAANVCCKIDPPSIPIFSNEGHLLYYQQSPCPEQYKTCCKGFISILGYCINLEVATAMLPSWQELAQSQGISLSDAIQMSGFLG